MSGENIKFGIIGTGIMAHTYAKILSQRSDCSVVAVVGNTYDRALRFSNEFRIKCYSNSSYAAMYTENNEINATIITTPEWVRLGPVKEAVKNGQHILLEKPFSAGMSEAWDLARLLSNYKRVFQICHVLRHSPRFQALYTAVSSGAVGAVRHIYARRYSNRLRVRRVLGRTDLAYWLAPHDIDIVRLLTSSEVVEVYAKSRNDMLSEDDYLIVHMKMANGVDVVLENSWCSPPLSGSAGGARFEVWGTKGAVQVDDSEMNVRVFSEESKVLTPDTYEDFEVAGIHHGIFENLLVFFINRVKKSVVDSEDVTDGLETVKVCSMISKSINEKRVVYRNELSWVGEV